MQYFYTMITASIFYNFIVIMMWCAVQCFYLIAVNDKINFHFIKVPSVHCTYCINEILQWRSRKIIQNWTKPFSKIVPVNLCSLTRNLLKIGLWNNMNNLQHTLGRDFGTFLIDMSNLLTIQEILSTAVSF